MKQVLYNTACACNHALVTRRLILVFCVFFAYLFVYGAGFMQLQNKVLSFEKSQSDHTGLVSLVTFFSL